MNESYLQIRPDWNAYCWRCNVIAKAESQFVLLVEDDWGSLMVHGLEAGNDPVTAWKLAHDVGAEQALSTGRSVVELVRRGTEEYPQPTRVGRWLNGDLIVNMHRYSMTYYIAYLHPDDVPPGFAEDVPDEEYVHWEHRYVEAGEDGVVASALAQHIWKTEAAPYSLVEVFRRDSEGENCIWSYEDQSWMDADKYFG